MRRIIALLLVFAMCLPLCTCGTGDADTSSPKEEIAETERPSFKNPKQEAFEISKEAYEYINDACDILEKIGYDVYEAWRLGVNNESEILASPCFYLADNLKLDEEEIRMGVAFCNLSYLTGNDWEEIPEDSVKTNVEYADNFFNWDKYPLFALCIWVVSSAYPANGEFSKAETALNNAKEQMKKLTADYSDYEYYPSLKEYYTVVNSYYDFCIKPIGTFNQAKTTFADYENKMRECQNDLNFIFED